LLAKAHLYIESLKTAFGVKRYQIAYIESFIGRLRYVCLNEHRFVSLAHAKGMIEGRLSEYT
jgi:putative transposase